jgi:hypothetical protein
MLIKKSTELSRPIMISLSRASPHTNALFKDYVRRCEEEHLKSGNQYYLSKREIERWGIYVSDNTRIQIVHVDTDIHEHLK